MVRLSSFNFGFVAVLFDFAIGARIHELDDALSYSNIKSSFGAHVNGLEQEHAFTVVQAGQENTDGVVWEATDQDQDIIREIVRMVQTDKADAKFVWTDEVQSWTFGLVASTSLTPVESLAQHMLHRHGLGPLLISQHKELFDTFEAPPDGSNNTVHRFVSKLEAFDQVKALYQLMTSMTLSGLRNLHSYDHVHSVKNSPQISSCTQSQASSCILQAGLSRNAHELLSENGMNSSNARSLQATMKSVLDGFDFYLPPLATGSASVRYSNAHQVGGKGNTYVVKGVIVFEGGYQVFHTTEAEVEDPSVDFTAKVEHILLKDFTSKHSKHKEYVGRHHLDIWSSEEADFWEMYCASKNQNPCT